MRRPLALLLPALALALCSAGAQADLLSNGVDTSRSSSVRPPQHPASGCHVLWYGVDIFGEVERYTALGYAITQATGPGDLTAANLAGYDVLVVAYTGPGQIGGAQPAIAAFVGGGGALLIHQPNAPGNVDYAPAGCEVNIQDAYWCAYPGGGFAQIVNSAHVITSGLTDADLSGAFDYVGPISPAYAVLAASAGCHDPALAVAKSGNGRVVFEDGNGCSQSSDPGSDTYWVHVFDWLCNRGTVPAGASTWGGLKAHYR